MKIKYIQGAILLALLLGIFFAFYLKNEPEIKKTKSVNTPPESPEAPEIFPESETIEPEVLYPLIKPRAAPKTEELISETLKSNTPNFRLQVTPAETFYVGIFGESLEIDLNEDPSLQDIAFGFLKMLSEKNVKGIFLTGNLIQSVRSSPQTIRVPVDHSDARANDLPGNNPAGNSSSGNGIVNQLKMYLSLNSEASGGRVPLFPTSGSTLKMSIFTDQFKNQGFNPFDENLGYTVSMGPAFFVVIATENILTAKDHANLQSSDKLLTWLNDVLTIAKKNHRFLFVIGHTPASFSSKIYSDIAPTGHDKLWKILVENSVNAYFSSGDHFYDRSYRYGVWQIISSGDEALLKQEGVSKPFFHCLLLTIPSNVDALPKVQVLDIEGNLIDSFELKKQADPLYQMRIS